MSRDVEAPLAEAREALRATGYDMTARSLEARTSSVCHTLAALHGTTAFFDPDVNAAEDRVVLVALSRLLSALVEPEAPDARAVTDAAERLRAAVPFIRIALEAAAIKHPGATVGLACIARKADGSGGVTAEFEGAAFLDDVEALLGTRAAVESAPTLL